MKTRETKQRDLVALTESLQNAKSAMVVSFTKITVNKDQEFRNRLREARHGAIARLAQAATVGERLSRLARVIIKYHASVANSGTF